MKTLRSEVLPHAPSPLCARIHISFFTSSPSSSYEVATYNNTSFRCTVFAPPHNGIFLRLFPFAQRLSQNALASPGIVIICSFSLQAESQISARKYHAKRREPPRKAQRLRSGAATYAKRGKGLAAAAKRRSVTIILVGTRSKTSSSYKHPQ